MTSAEWLENKNKKPYQPCVEGCAPASPFWHWATYLCYGGHEITEEEIEPEELEYTIPIPVWKHLRVKITYPYVRAYRSPSEALEDFDQAFNKAVKEGWDCNI